MVVDVVIVLVKTNSIVIVGVVRVGDGVVEVDDE